MAFTNRGTKWELKNSLYLIFSFIPFFNSICFFHMNGNVPKKKYKRAGWIALGLNIFIIVTVFTCALLTGVNIEEVPYDTMPSLEDYLGRNYYEKYSSYSEYNKLPAYYDYLDAVDEWENSEKVKSIRAKNETFHSTVEGIGAGSVLGWFLVNMVIFFYLISIRASYIKELANNTNKNDVKNRLETMSNSANNKSINNNTNNNLIKNNTVISKNVIKSGIQSDLVKTKTDQITGKLDINVATEEQLTNLPLLTAIDAKRVIDYRQEHNGFESVDEFFDVINAKPHIIAKLDSVLYISNPRTTRTNNNPRTTTYKTNRRIDL